MDNGSKALKSGLWYFIANFVVKGMALITTPIFTRLMTKSAFGDYSNFFSWASIAAIVITMSMESSLISAKFDYEKRLDQYNLSLVGLAFASTAVWAVVINVFSGFFCDLLNLRLFYINLILIYSFFGAIVNVYQMHERFQYRYKAAVFVALLVAVTTAALSVGLVVGMEDTLTGRVIGTVVPTLAVGLALMIPLTKKGKRVDVGTWPYVLKICIPYVPHLLSLTVLNSVDRIMITRICGSTDNALYSVAYTCGHMVTILMIAMNGAFAPWLGDKLHEKAFDQIRKISKYYILGFCVLAVLMMLLAPEILWILGGKSYMEAQFVIAPVAMGCVCQFLYTLFVNVEQYEKKTVGMAFASVAAAVLNFFLNAVFIPKFGYIAAAYTTLAGYLFLLAVHMLLVKRMGFGKAFSYGYVAGTVAVMMAVTLLVNYLYTNIVVRIIVFGVLIAALLVAMYIKRDVMKPLVRKVIK